MPHHLAPWTFTVALGLLLWAGQPGPSQAPRFALPTPPDQHPVTAKLLVDHQAVQPGQSVTVGLLLSMPEHWHVYWKNPGESGMATQVNWQLPDGWDAQPLRWPIPKRFDQPGGVLGYGYEQSVLLTSRVTVPADAKVGRRVELGVTANWLACKQLCIAGEAQLTTTLSVGQTPQPTHRALFQRWADRLPKPINDQSPVQIGEMDISQTGKNTWQVEARLDWSQRPATVQWYPGASGDWLIEDVQRGPGADRKHLRFVARYLAGPADPASGLGFDSLIVYQLGDSQPQARSWPISIADNSRVD